MSDYEMKNPTAELIDQLYVDSQTPEDSDVLRPSKIGEPCEFSLWLTYRWTTPLVRHEGRLERLFQDGHWYEARIVEDLKRAGLVVEDRDPATGKQWRATLAPWFKGSADGKILGVPEAPKTWHLLEIKTMNDSKFTTWLSKGVAHSHPTYWTQAQTYMHGLGLTRTLLVAINKNTSQIWTERIHYDPVAAARIVAKAERVAFANMPPERNESFACRWCDHKGICKEDKWPRVNCRTCLSSTLMADGTWRCERHDIDIDYAAQQEGCEFHLWIPDLVPGEQHDFDDTHMEVTYILKDGSTFIDGKEDKRNG